MSRNFNGSSDRLDADISPPSVYSIAAWFKGDAAVSDEQQIIQIQDQSATDHYFRLCIKHDGSDPLICARARSGGGASEAFGTTVIAANTWYHAGVSWISSTERPVWLDGVNEVTDTDSESPAGLDSITIGAAGDSSPGDYFDGDICEVGLWDVELTAAEWALLAAGYSPLLVRPAALVYYWPLVGRSSPEIDLIGGVGLTLDGTAVAAHPRIIYPAPRYVGLGSPAAVVGNPWYAYAQQ